jgi:solute carrier family 45, member 1/2/4
MVNPLFHNEPPGILMALVLASPYLLSLGLSKSLMSIVFVAGPLSGLIVQPLIGQSAPRATHSELIPRWCVGVLADRSTSSFGRRRPYMLAGSLFCGGALLLLGFTREVASIFTKLSTHAVSIYQVLWDIEHVDEHLRC